jgi:hypothetical protein
MRPTTASLPPRVTDRVEDAVAWALLACALFVVALGVVTGMAVFAATVERARVEAAERTRTAAVLVQDVPTVPVTNPTTGRMPVTATWHDADGAVHTGVIEAGVGLAAGAEVPVWVDPSGAVVPAPVSVHDAQPAGLLACVAVVVAGGAVLAGLWWVVRRATAARNADIWEQEWTRVGPAWRRDDDVR